MIQALRQNLKALSITPWGGIALGRSQPPYRPYLEFYRQLFKDRFTTETAERLGISQQVVDFLVEEVLVLQRAQAAGVPVGGDELRAKIQAIRAFQEDGKFSRDRYVAILNRAKIDPAIFQADQRRGGGLAEE